MMALLKDSKLFPQYFVFVQPWNLRPVVTQEPTEPITVVMPELVIANGRVQAASDAATHQPRPRVVIAAGVPELVIASGYGRNCQ